VGASADAAFAVKKRKSAGWQAIALHVDAVAAASASPAVAVRSRSEMGVMRNKPVGGAKKAWDTTKKKQPVHRSDLPPLTSAAAENATLGGEDGASARASGGVAGRLCGLSVPSSSWWWIA
jgi:hypothetical protein